MSLTRTAPPSFLFLLLLLGLLAMFTASFRAVVETTVSPVPQRNAAAVNAGEVSPTPAGIAALPDGGPELALTEKQADDLTELMRALQANPEDADALMKIGDTFLMAKEWQRAEVFLNRAVLSRPADVRPRYMLGICLYQQGKIDEARQAYTELLDIREDPPALYNLALIYKYHLNNPDKAGELLQKLLNSPETDVDTLEKAKKEL